MSPGVVDCPGLFQGSSRAAHTHTARPPWGANLTCLDHPGEQRPGPPNRVKKAPRSATSGVRPKASMQVRCLQHTAVTGTFRSSQPHSAGRWHLLGVQQQARQQGSNKQDSSASNSASSIRKVCGVLSHDCGPRTPQTFSSPTVRRSPCRRGSHSSSRRSRSEPAHRQHQPTGQAWRNAPTVLASIPLRRWPH
jgi:hypothetical protein